MKHAYLIIAHTNWEQLQKLVSLVDDERNDIYIHIDKKVNIESLWLHTDKSPIHFVDRIDIRWGTSSIIEAELSLFETAIRISHSYYHLISGFDLPIKSQNSIHDFFHQNQGKEFIGFGSKDWDVEGRIYCYNLFGRQMRNSNLAVRYLCKAIRMFANYLQIKLHVYPNKSKDRIYRYGCEWVSVTHCFAEELVKQKTFFLRRYKYSYCPDEIYKQTFAYNSKYRDHIYDLKDEFRGCMREIDWIRGRPYIFTESDYDMLINSDKLFARKFDQRKDEEIIDKLVNYIQNGK